MSSSGTIVHDPSAVLDYTWDWSTWLSDGETITAHTVAAAGDALTVDSTTTDGATVTAWLSATPGPAKTYRVTCHIVTSAGRQDDRSHSILVADR